MNRLVIPLLSFLSLVLLTSWRTPEAKDGANFYGMLITQQGNKFKVNNISIGDGKKTKQIPMYEKPKKHERPTAPKNGNKGIKEIILNVNPKSDLAITYIDLNETSEIKVPYPNIVWRYQQKEGYRTQEYLEIMVVSKGIKKKKSCYLLERETDVYCSGIAEAGPEEKKVPLSAIDRLIIEGYYYKEDRDGQNSINKKQINNRPPEYQN